MSCFGFPAKYSLRNGTPQTRHYLQGGVSKLRDPFTIQQKVLRSKYALRPGGLQIYGDAKRDGFLCAPPPPKEKLGSQQKTGPATIWLQPTSKDILSQANHGGSACPLSAGHYVWWMGISLAVEWNQSSPNTRSVRQPFIALANPMGVFFAAYFSGLPQRAHATIRWACVKKRDPKMVVFPFVSC